MKKNTFFLSVLLGMCMLISMPTMAQTKIVKMTTKKTVGSSMSFLVNHNNKGVTVDWGDGNPVAYKTNKEEGICSIDGVVKGATITVSGEANWDMLSCKGCELTVIDLSDAKELRSLYCQNNELKTLDLKGMTKLVDLNCANNQISSLNFTDRNNAQKDLAAIENLNISNNQLTGQYYMKLNTLQHLDLSNNLYKSCYVYDPQLTSFDCSGNNLSGSMNLSKCTKLSSIVCKDNALKSLTLANSGENAYQILCDNNQIQKLDLANAREIVDLSCSNNGVKDFTMNEYAHFYLLNLSGNNLAFNALPAKNREPKYLSFLPQEPFNISHAEGLLTKDGVPYAPVCSNWSEIKNNTIFLNKYCSLVSGRIDAEYKWVSIDDNGNETTLIQRRNSREEGDYYASRGNFAFFTPHKRAYLEIKSKSYGFVVRSMPIAIGDDITAVESIINNDSKLHVDVVNGDLLLDAKKATIVNIYTIEGKNVWQNVVSGPTTVNLPKGVYIVNGKKVIL